MAVTSSSIISIDAPASSSLRRIASIRPESIPLTVTEPFVIIPAIRYVAASILSGITSASAEFASGTPVILIVGVPSPLTGMPISLSTFARFTISGSSAAFSINVTPCARAAAIMRFSVAPTDG